MAKTTTTEQTDTNNSPQTPAKRGRKPGVPQTIAPPLDFSAPIYVLIDNAARGPVFLTFTDRAACDAEASRITLATGRDVARLTTYAVTKNVPASVADVAFAPI